MSINYTRLRLFQPISAAARLARLLPVLCAFAGICALQVKADDIASYKPPQSALFRH